MALTLLIASSLASAGDLEPPSWAYPLNPPASPSPTTDDGTVRHVPGSAVGLTRAQIIDRFTAVDWYPGAHPPMPEPVAHGRRPDVFACGFCHYPNGQGRPENAGLAGLPASYMIEQATAMREGSRRSSQPGMISAAAMLKVAAHAADAEIAAAAAYYASIAYKPWIRVVEADNVPRPEIHGISAYAAADDGSREPIGGRIVEVPVDPAKTDLRDDTSGFIAYVPPGAVARGRALAASAAADHQPCGTCHGVGLRGGLGPPLAGRSPSYLFRQLFDMRSGTRSDPGSAAMKLQVASLTAADMRDLVAFAASLPP